MSKQLKGIGASEGIALAKPLVLNEQPLNLKNTKITDVDGEIAKFKQAVETTINDLEKLRITAVNKLGEDKAAIFEAHKEIAQDPAISEEVINEIKTNQTNAAYAVSQVANKFKEMFEGMDDDYFRERASDIVDVSSRMIRHILGIKLIDLSTISEEVIIVADDLTPSQTAQLDKTFVKGFATNVGGRTSHAAIMARSLEIPAVLGLKDVTSQIKDQEMIALNGTTGIVLLDLSETDLKEINAQEEAWEAERANLKTFIDKKSVTQDGHEVLIEANIGTPSDVQNVLDHGGEGIGLFRSEFLYMDSDHFPTEEEQFNAYKQVVSEMNQKMVIIRTLDIGGDKKLSYYKFKEEMNPFLGVRATRFTLANPTIFKAQIRALLRASSFGNLGIMFPMIATIEEFNEAKALVEECKKELDQEKIAYNPKVQVGMMVEIPAAAVNADKFAEVADFFSIGTNDLVQYSMAADRMSEGVAYLYQPLNPAILRLIKMTIDGGHKHNKWVGMCGEMAGDIEALPILIGLGLDAFSMSASSMLKARSVINGLNYEATKKLALEAIDQTSSEQVEKLVANFLKDNKIN